MMLPPWAHQGYDGDSAAAGDGELQRTIDVRADVGAFDRKRRQRRGDIEDGECFGGSLDRAARCGHARGKRLEDFEFERKRAIGGVGDLCLKLAEYGGGETDLACERLAVDEIGVERRF